MNNRIIKFRCWDVKNKCWHTPTDWSSEESDLYIGYGDIPEVGLRSNEYFIWCQFTGLTDKNGVDIFEGDLLREPAKNEWEKENYLVQEVFWHDNNQADQHVGWQMNRCHWQGNTCGGSIWNKMLPKYTEKMEVIGNIYENPELVENNK